MDFHRLYQNYNQQDEDFLKEFKEAYEVVHQNGGLLGGHPTLVMRSLHKIKKPFNDYDQSLWVQEPSETDYAGGRSTSRVPAFPNIMGKKLQDKNVSPKDIKKQLMMQRKLSWQCVCFDKPTRKGMATSLHTSRIHTLWGMTNSQQP